MAVQNYGYLKTLWDAFLPWLNNNEYGVAGLMGNLYAESGCVPFRVQGDMTFPFTFSTNYTQNVDNGTIGRYAFCHNGPNGGGYGLAQWTYYTRKETLYDRWQNGSYTSIGDINLAIDQIKAEISGTAYNNTLYVLQNASSIAEASDKVLVDYENPKDQSAAVKALRQQYATDIYNMYSGGGGSPDPPTPDPPPPPYPVDPTAKRNMPVWMMIKPNQHY